MSSSPRIALVAAALAALFAPVLSAAEPAAPRSKRAVRRTVDNRPLPAGVTAGSVMAPMARGDCSICHVNADPKNPGALRKAGNALCFGCHDEFVEIMERAVKHPPAVQACTSCHNPHNAREKKLLNDEQSAQCFDCHKEMKDYVLTSKVKHGALTEKRKCGNCHNPHGAAIEKLLIAPTFDECMGCHSVDNLKDWGGVTLTNYRRLLDSNAVWHKPVSDKDCSACHRTHGGSNFRLLVAPYPAKFYAGYDLGTYALCYSCHNSKVVTVEETQTLTRFRDGSRNLHFVHVNKADRGRTCRACHDVHAAAQEHRMRDGVPFGKDGWVLKINHKKTPTGGSCVKTCHEAKTYNNKTVAAAR